jgi:trk system potassium uptake protein TrkH
MVRLALALVSLFVLAILLLIVAVSYTEITMKGLPPNAATATRYFTLVFELLAAFGNVGFRTGITPTLEPISRIFLIVAMFFGRIGPLAFIYIFAQPKRPQLRRLPEEPVMAS